MTAIRWAPGASEDLGRIDDYYATIDTHLAVRIVDAILFATELLADHPLSGPQIDGRPFRKWRVAGTPYVIFYAADTDVLRVLRVLHGAQDRTRAL